MHALIEPSEVPSRSAICLFAFNGDNAKLIWVVSLDGKKKQSETYKVLAILDKPKTD
jgi:hypothetical protein